MHYENELNGKTIIVTGASQSLGLSIATYLVHLGAKVVNLDIQAPTQELNNSHWIKCDLSQANVVKNSFDTLFNTYSSIYGFIGNAGIYYLNPLEETSLATLEDIFRVNVFSHYQCLQLLMPHFKKNGFGRVILMGSEQASIGRSLSSAYSMSKAALMQLVRTSAAEIPKGMDIRINGLCPAGIMNTGMNEQALTYFAALLEKSPRRILDLFSQEVPLGELITADNIAKWCAWLLTDGAHNSQGNCFQVDGGFLNLRP